MQPSSAAGSFAQLTHAIGLNDVCDSLRLDLHSHLPRFAVVDTAKDSDTKRAREVCAGLREGEIVIFDKAYVDFAHLHDLHQRGVWWVTRAKENMQYRVVKRRLKKPDGKILRGDEILLTGTASFDRYPARLRRVAALVEIDGEEREMTLLTYVLLRYLAFLSRWSSSFIRLWAVVRSGLWLRLDLVALLKSCGTAGGDFRLLGRPEQAYLPGFRPQPMG